MRSEADALERARELLGEFETVSLSPAGRVSLGNAHVERLRAVGGFAVEPKQAWTNVADFTSRGVDAINLGPGETRYAHTREERVEIAAMERVFEALQRFLLAGTV